MVKKNPNSIISKVVKGIIILFISSLVCIFLFERLVFYVASKTEGFFKYDPDIGFMVRPGANNSNRFGFNDRDYTLQKEPDHYRMLVLGDSFGWIGGQDGNYTALLEKMFENHYEGKHRVDVINTGYPGTHTGEQLLILRKYAIQYNPDLVVLGFFCGNDVYNADPRRKRVMIGDIYIDTFNNSDGKASLPFGALFFSALKKCLVIGQEKINKALESFRSHLLQSQEAIAKDPKVDPESPGRLSRKKFLKIEKERLSVFDKQNYQNDKFEAHFQFIFDQLLEMNEFLKRKGIELIVALYPDEFQVNDELFQVIMEEYGLNAQQYDLELVQRLVRAHLDKHSIPYIDLFGDFRSNPHRRELYLLRDTHWNENGIKLVATILFNYLIPIVDSNLKEPIGANL